MFKDNESPVSLFAFQDIITSLTGIMIFFLLLLALNILEKVPEKEKNDPAEKELELLQRKNALLRKHNTDIASEISTYRSQIKEAAKKDEAALLAEYFQLKEYIGKLKKQQLQLETYQASEKDLLQRSEGEKRDLMRKKKLLEENIARGRLLAEQNKQKKKRMAELQKKIKSKGRSVIVTLDSSIRKDPVLIECSASKIRIYNQKTHFSKEFIRETPVITAAVDAAIQQLRTYSVSGHYFVFLVKPGAAGYIRYFSNRFLTDMQGADWGMEPIYEKEGTGE